MHPAYQQIIDMDPLAIPSILHEMKAKTQQPLFSL